MCGHFNLQNIELYKILFIIIILIIVDIFSTILLILSFDQINTKTNSTETCFDDLLIRIAVFTLLVKTHEDNKMTDYAHIL